MAESLSSSAYHVTPASSIRSVMTNGLVPKIGDRSVELGESQPRIYLFPDEASLNDGLGNWLGEALDGYGDLAILKIDVSGIQLDSEVEWELICNSIIEPSRIEVLRVE